MSEGRWNRRGEFVPEFPRSEPADQSGVDVVLTEAEMARLANQPPRRAGR